MSVFTEFCGFCRPLLLTFLLVAVLLFSSLLFAGVFMMNGCSGVSLENAVHVKNETELKNAVSSASSKEFIIALDSDVALTESLVISANKDVTLASSKIVGYYKLIGAEGVSTIVVDDGGVLRLNGIIVTHVKDAGKNGGGVYVAVNGLLIMYGGEISGNVAFAPDGPFYSSSGLGGGVFNLGVFELYGGKISENMAYGAGSSGDGSGGGGV